jgi:hypothetical protein
MSRFQDVAWRSGAFTNAPNQEAVPSQPPRARCAACRTVDAAKRVPCPPRDYLQDPFQFGRDATQKIFVPHDGDEVSARVARVQHLLVCRLAEAPDRHRARRVCEPFGFSKQLWSLCLSGQAWMGEAVLAAAVGELLLAGSDG